MTSESKDALRDVIIRVGPVLFLIGLAWGTLKAEVTSKADKSAVEADHALLVQMDARQVKIEHILCSRDHTGCDGVTP